MRLWSLHPKYLDAKGLVALWREGLLAQKVINGGTTGYTRHPQLIRFNATHNPSASIAQYLYHVALEADARGYRFNHEKIGSRSASERIEVTQGQLDYECEHLGTKLRVRDNARYISFNATAQYDAHPQFDVVAGEIAAWEIITNG